MSISVVCSRWNEPFGRASLEAASRGSAVIISNKGGLPETSKNAIKLKVLDTKNLFITIGIHMRKFFVKDISVRIINIPIKVVVVKTYRVIYFDISLWI